MTTEYIDDSAKSIEKKVCEFPLNRTYTLADSKVEGDYIFDAPYDWVSSRSPNKCIGLREAKLVPESMSLGLQFDFYALFKDKTETETFIPVNLMITEEHDMYTILNNLENDVNSKISDASIIINYNDDKLEMQIKNENENIVRLLFKITEGREKFLHLLNQPKDSDAFEQYVEKVELQNVWDRQTCYFHASFSNDLNQILCENKSVYSPREYLFSSTQPTFRLWFTSDTKTLIKFLYPKMTLKLVFIYNYKTAAI